LIFVDNKEFGKREILEKETKGDNNDILSRERWYFRIFPLGRNRCIPPAFWYVSIHTKLF